MKNIMKKELILSMHPTAPMFLTFSMMLLIPGYPYLILFFYTSLAVFFTCLNGRENNDVFYTMMLPVAKKDIVKGRFIFVILLELMQMALAIPFAVIRQNMPVPGNPVGMEANITLFGLAFVMMGIFNFFFFSIYYKDVTKVGKSFILPSVIVFLFIGIVETCTHAVPFIRDCLDTKDPLYLGWKLGILAAGMVIYGILTYTAYRKSIRAFERLDL